MIWYVHFKDWLRILYLFQKVGVTVLNITRCMLLSFATIKEYNAGKNSLVCWYMKGNMNPPYQMFTHLRCRAVLPYSQYLCLIFHVIQLYYWGYCVVNGVEEFYQLWTIETLLTCGKLSILIDILSYSNQKNSKFKHFLRSDYWRKNFYYTKRRQVEIYG